MSKRIRYTEKQKEILYELEDGKKSIWMAGNKPVIGTGHGGEDSEGVAVNLKTFEALVRKGALMPSEYWLSEELSEEGVPA